MTRRNPAAVADLTAECWFITRRGSGCIFRLL